MTDEKVKAAVAILREHAGAMDAELQAERDKLAALLADRSTELDWERSARLASEAKLTALVEIVEAARDLVMKPGGLVNRGVGVGLVVVEKADKSDPHCRLCTAFEKLDAQALAHHSAPVGEPEDGQDRKFAFRNGQFVNRVSGEPIPKDEPIIIFRARDRHAMSVLAHYLDLAQDPHHQQAIRDRIAEFQAYREANPERLKEPGITRDITLAAPPSTPTSAPVEDV